MYNKNARIKRLLKKSNDLTSFLLDLKNLGYSASDLRETKYRKICAEHFNGRLLLLKEKLSLYYIDRDYGLEVTTAIHDIDMCIDFLDV